MKNELIWFSYQAKKMNWLNKENIELIDKLLSLNFNFEIKKWDKSIYRKMFWMSDKSHILHSVQFVAKINDSVELKYKKLNERKK